MVSAGSRVELEAKSTTAMNYLTTWCSGRKLQISEEKTTNAFLRRSMQRNPIIKLNGKTLCKKSATRYLGVDLGERGSYAEHVHEICKKATATMLEIVSIAQRQYRIPLPAVQKYMSAVMATIVTYEASVWAGKAKQVKPRQDLNSAQRGVLVRLTGAYRTTSTDALQVIAGTLPMDLEVLKNASAYWLRKGETDRIEELLQVRPDSKTAIHERVLELWQERWAS